MPSYSRSEDITLQSTLASIQALQCQQSQTKQAGSNLQVQYQGKQTSVLTFPYRLREKNEKRAYRMDTFPYRLREKNEKRAYRMDTFPYRLREENEKRAYRMDTFPYRLREENEKRAYRMDTFPCWLREKNEKKAYRISSAFYSRSHHSHYSGSL